MKETTCETLKMRHYRTGRFGLPGDNFRYYMEKKLIYKIYKVGVKGMFLAILDSFLTNRFSRKLVNGYVSEWFESDIGLIGLGGLYLVQHYF